METSREGSSSSKSLKLRSLCSLHSPQVLDEGLAEFKADSYRLLGTYEATRATLYFTFTDHLCNLASGSL